MARFRLELGPVPLHHQVYLDLLALARCRSVAAGRSTPDRARLATHYGCSLITVRRALDELVREGRIERTRGRGTFVLHPRIDRDIAGRASFTEEMRQRGLDPETRLVVGPAGVGVGRRGRRRSVSNPARRRSTSSGCAWPAASRCCSSRSTCRRSGSRACSRATSSTAPSTSCCRRATATQVVRAREALEPVLLRAREARLLDQRAGAPALLIEGIASTADGRRSSSAGRTSAAIAPATTSNARSIGRSGRPRCEAMAAQEEERDGEHRHIDRSSRDGGRRACRRRPRAVRRPAVGAGAARRGLRPADDERRRRRGSAAAGVHRAVAGCVGRRSAAPPPPTPLPVTDSQAKPGDVVIRWYCCLGTGDAPEQVEVERKVAEDFNASHPGIHLQFEGYIYAAARDALAVQLGVGQRARHRRSGRHRRRRSVPRPVAGPAAAHRQERLRHEPVPAVDRRPLQRRRRGPGRHPVRDLPVGAVLQGRHVQGGRSRRAAARVERRRTRCPTARAAVGLRHGPRDRQDPDRRRERQGRDRGGLRSEKIVQWGFEPQRDDLRQTGAYWGPARSWPRTARRPRSPSLGRGVEAVLRRHLDGPLQHDRRRSSRPPTSTRPATRSSPARSR